MLPGRHFEVFGMDILMDDQFKLWLLECNNSPGLCDSPDILKEIIRSFIKTKILKWIYVFLKLIISLIALRVHLCQGFHIVFSEKIVIF